MKLDKEQTLTDIFLSYLDCPCELFEPMEDRTVLAEAFHRAVEQGKKEGFVPMLVCVDDTLLESLLMNSDSSSFSGESWNFDRDTVRAYRREMCELKLEEGRDVLAKLLEERREESEDDGMDWEEEIIGEVANGEAITDFVSCFDSAGNTRRVLLAKIPVSNPWKVFAWLPFGGWNECPDTRELMAAAKYWYEAYGAVPVSMSNDELEFMVPDPVRQEDAMLLASEMYGFCPDRIDACQKEPYVGTLADTLARSVVWYFWWD